MADKDYYDTLGVDRNASKADIKSAYKKLAKKYHPDKFQDESEKKTAEEKFKEINEAAAILGDDAKRQQYDQFGKVNGASDFSGFDYNDFGGFTDFGDIFDQFFGGGMGGFGSFGQRRGSRGGGVRQYRGNDLRFDMNITLEEAAKGIEKTIKIPRMEKCDKCGGIGAKDSSDIDSCSTCHGSGRQTVTKRTPFGLFQTTSTCRTCGGEGKVVKNPCAECRGEGIVEKSAKLKIRIPEGVEDGSRLRITGEGEAGRKGGPHGDLFVVIHVKQHDVFQRLGNDLYLEVPISFTQAALGDTVQIPTIDGKTRLKIPEGTQTNTTFLIKGKGIPNINGYGRGAERVKVVIETPEKLNKKQKDLLKKFSDEMGEKSSPSKGFFEKFFGK
ncbi:MAG: molecular chaperone DnaJ [Nanoarchaeota archaeon]|nr:molecular chaperone DnaJ [Nanoarchaeota archaeon]